LETEKTFRFVSKRLLLWKISGYSLGFFPTLFFGDSWSGRNICGKALHGTD